MNKKSLLVVASLFVVAIAAMLIAGEATKSTKPWVDMQNCEFCKPWTAGGLMKDMQWEQHNIAGGVMCISTVPPARMAEYKKASDQMDVLGKKAASGEKIQMCGSCEAMGGLMMRGAKMEQVWLKNGSVMLLTSSDAAIVTDLHKWADKNNEEFSKMAATPEK